MKEADSIIQKFFSISNIHDYDISSQQRRFHI